MVWHNLQILYIKLSEKLSIKEKDIIANKTRYKSQIYIEVTINPSSPTVKSSFANSVVLRIQPTLNTKRL